jgi:hypothetical protein
MLPRLSHLGQGFKLTARYRVLVASQAINTNGQVPLDFNCPKRGTVNTLFLYSLSTEFVYVSLNLFMLAISLA